MCKRERERKRDMTALAEEIKNEWWRQERRKSATELGKNARTENGAKRVVAEATKRSDEQDRAREEEGKRDSGKERERDTHTQRQRERSEVTRGRVGAAIAGSCW